ncbi:MAG: hypothetical protein ACI857_001354 [Arenicella sp.]|jgi:hypothetical protein
MKLIITSLAILAACSSQAQCITDSTNNVFTFTYDGKVYEIVKETKNWADAAACAVINGGALLEIDSQAEQDTIWSALESAGITNANTVAPDGGNASYVWIGGNDLATEGTWVWDGDDNGSAVQFWQGTSSGSPVGGLFNNWGNEPDDFNGNQDNLGLALTDWPLGVEGQWNDLASTNLLYFVIEHPVNSNTIIEPDIKEFTVYPNPANEEVTIELPFIFDIPTEQKIYVYDNGGKLVETVLIDGELMKIDTRIYNAGVYHVYVNETHIKDFVVQH